MFVTETSQKLAGVEFLIGFRAEIGDSILNWEEDLKDHVLKEFNDGTISFKAAYIHRNQTKLKLEEEAVLLEERINSILKGQLQQIG